MLEQEREFEPIAPLRLIAQQTTLVLLAIAIRRLLQS